MDLDNLPDSPGVYLHKDKDGNIIYVGKAVSLRSRVRQYFQSSKNQDAKTRSLVKNIADTTTIQTKTEMEALILECNLIKKYMPKYNVLLRDDKTFPYIKITDEKWPRILKTRRIEKDGAKYFGPYTDVAVVNNIIELLNHVYTLKRCGWQNFPTNHTPCLNFHIQQCPGMCVGKADHETYLKAIGEVEQFLLGKDAPVLAFLTEKMNREAENLNFELAAAYRDYIGHVHEMTKMAKIAKASKIAREAKAVENTKLLGDRQRKNRERIIAEEESLNKIFRNEQQRIYGWRIEAYDISNTNGVDSVGVMVVFQEGRPDRKEYRRFKIQTIEGPNDYGSLQEVLYRRMKRAKDGSSGFSHLPNLILMDGGKAQVSVVEQVLKAMQIDIPVAGMVKDDKHRTRGLIYHNEEIDLQEHLFLKTYLGKIQEEVHRFAIDYHRGLRNKSMMASALDHIEGVGEKRKMGLLSHFKSMEAIQKASIEELCEAPNMTKLAAEKVYEYFH